MPVHWTLPTQMIASTIAALGLVWGATQWAAVQLAYQAALGTPWMEFAGHAIYAPWKVFGWWVAFNAQAPDVFARVGPLAAAAGVAPALIALTGAALRVRARPVVTTYGSARWADFADVSGAGLLRDQGVVLGHYGAAYLRHDGPEHVLAVAPTRSGKGVGLVVPTLLSWPHSTVIHDIKGENWNQTAGWRATQSTCLKFDPTSADTVHFNPLLEVRKGVHEVRDVQNIADILVDPDGARERRDHWEKTAHALLTGAILHVLYAEADKTLNRVATFLADPSRSIERTMRIMLATNHVGTDDAPAVHPVVASIARELLNKSENERSGVVSTAMSLLGLYRDPLIAEATATSDFRLIDLVDAAHPVSLYLVVPPSDLSRTRPLTRLILNQIARRLTEHLPTTASRERQPLLLLLDEFPALGRLEFFEGALAFLAGYGVRCLLIAQSLNQIDKAYGSNNAILDNCHVRVAFAPNDERTAKRLSDALGTTTELRSQTNLSGHRLAPWLSRVAVAEQETPRPLLTPGEVLQLPYNDALVLVSGTPPIRAQKLRYFEEPLFRRRCLPPPRICSRSIGRAPANAWGTATRSMDHRLQVPWSDQVAAGGRRMDPARERAFGPNEPVGDMSSEDLLTAALDPSNHDEAPDRAAFDDISGL